MKLIILCVLLLLIVSADSLSQAKDCICKNLVSSRIIGGNIVTNQQAYPWLVSITTSLDQTKTSACAATILNEFTLLTAGKLLGFYQYKKETKKPLKLLNKRTLCASAFS